MHKALILSVRSVCQVVRFRVAFFSILSVLSTSTTAAQEPDTKWMVLTFDDLPYGATPYPATLSNASRTTTAILEALATYQAPVIAFVTESKLHKSDEVDELSTVLQLWIDAGAILGNHTYGHADLNTTSVEEFKREIDEGEIVTRRLMEGRQPYQLYFRHPYTHTGDTETKKTLIERYLAERGYRIAPHTIDSHDYLFNRGYLYSKERGDSTTARLLCETYIEFVLETTQFAESAAAGIFGRQIPHTILLHANDINGDCLSGVLYTLKEYGYEFISLDEAMFDAAYRTRDTFVTPYGPTWLWRWMKSKDMAVSFSGDPEPPGWVYDLYRRASQPNE